MMFEKIIYNSIKILIFLTAIISAENNPTIIKQTFRFKTLPDDGSYSLTIRNLSCDLNITGHEGSGASIVVEKITFGIKEEDIPNIHKKENIIVNHTEDQNQINIIGDDSISKTDFIQTSIHLDLPKHINLNFNILGGDIIINKIIGNLELSTLGGDISIFESKGEIYSKTNGGTVTVKNSAGSSKLSVFECRCESFFSP